MNLLIPSFNQSGVLPPFIGGSAAQPASASPYRVTIEGFVERFAVSPERANLIQGLFEFLGDVIQLNLQGGFLWIDGSFVEDVERTRERPPSDIDIVFFIAPPEGMDEEALMAFASNNIELFDSKLTKEKYGCEVFPVNLCQHPVNLVHQTSYWLNLFSHHKDSNMWKGMVELALEDPTIEDAKSILRDRYPE